jgi:hypothetical protein
MKTVIAAIFIVIICSVFTGFGQKGVTSFYGEDSWVRPGVLPEAVLYLLKNDPEVRKCNSGHGRPENEVFSADWFEATKISLKRGMRSVLLVKSPNVCPSGNAVSFWAFEKEGGKYKTVFYTYTLSLDIQKKTTNGRYNIATCRCTASACMNRIFAFNGRRYIQKREWWTPQS